MPHCIIRALFGIGVLLAAPSVAASRIDLEKAMQSALLDNGLTGVTWALVTPAGIEVGASGIRNADTGDALSAADRVHVGSGAKTLIASAVLQLISQGKLTLDTPVAPLLPGLHFENPWSSTHPIRVSHLLDHTAGLDDARMWQVFSSTPTAGTPLVAAFAGDASLLRVRTRPGRRGSYSNMGYTLLGMIVESLSGQRYETYLDATLLRPLGMHDSTFAFVSQAGADADPRLAMGHFEGGKTQAAVPVYLRPAGQFTTTALDMGRFAQFLLGDDRIGGASVIEHSLLQRMGHAEGTEAVDAGLIAGFRLGLAQRDRNGVVGRCHGGSTIGYRAMFCLFPQHGKAYFSSINTDSETADYSRFDALLTAALDMPRATPPAHAQPPADIDAWRGYYVPSPNRFASFSWLDTTLGFMHANWDGSALHLNPLQLPAKRLSPIGGAMFMAGERVAASHVVLVSAEGKRVITDGVLTYEKKSTVELLLLWSSLAGGVLGLAWIVLSGVLRLLRRRMRTSAALRIAFIAVVALLLPAPLFMAQSFLTLGDVTPASAVLAVVTGTLPLALVIALLVQLRLPRKGVADTADTIAMIALLQLSAVLAVWGLLPLRLWQI